MTKGQRWFAQSSQRNFSSSAAHSNIVGRSGPATRKTVSKSKPAKTDLNDGKFIVGVSIVGGEDEVGGALE